MSVTLAQLRERVRERFEHDSTVRWTDSDIDAAINAGLGELSEGAGFYESSIAVDLKHGRTYYDLRAIMPYTAIKITRICDSGNEWLEPTAPRLLGRREWERSEGEPDHWFLRGLFWLGLYPKPNADTTDGITIYYTEVHPLLTSDGDTLQQLPDSAADCLVDYALYDLYAQEGETQKALSLWQSYQEGETALRQLVERRVVRPRLGRMAYR